MVATAPLRNDQPVIAVVGNPNTGKSALFNNLTGLRQKTANYPGVTVERHTESQATPMIETLPIALMSMPTVVM